MTFDAKILAKINKTDTCWLWTAAVETCGYGFAKYKGKGWRAHRLVWFLTHGAVPQNDLLHSCNNRLCVNPSHLREGSHSENMSQAAIEGKFVKKLTLESARQIKTLLAQGVRISTIARQFKVTDAAIHRIKNGQAWRYA